MSEEDCAEWAQLVCVTDTDTPPFLIAKDKFTIGRSQNCDISHDKNKMVSSSHCYILRDESGKVWLYDTSTNGTLLNFKIKLSKGECREIEHGDEFFVVHKKGEESTNIGYVFQDLARLKEEEENDDSGELEQTLEYEDGPPPVEATIMDDDINQVDEEEETKSAVKRKRGASPDKYESPSGKRVRTSDSEADASSDTTSLTTPDAGTAKTQDTSASVEGKDDAGKAQEEEGKDEKKELSKSGGGDAGKAGGGAAKGGVDEDDAFAETLTCTICQELLYDCVSVQPCMHSFCAGCYSEWMAHSPECPSCRGKVDRINKNHIVNNLVEAYLKEHPEKRRPEEDTKELDAKNKITRDMLYPKRQRRNSSDYENSDDYDDDDDDGGFSRSLPAQSPTGSIFGIGAPLFGTINNAYRAVCRQCPGQTDQSACSASGVVGSVFSAIRSIFGGPQTTTATTTTTNCTTSTAASSNNNNNNSSIEEQPCTSGSGTSGEAAADYKERDKKTMPVAPAYTCVPNQNHVLCQCCLQIFPDRRHEYNTSPDTLPPQQCTICYRAYCHAYWGCRKVGCNGCLAKFGDLNFGRQVLHGLILNHHESEIFTNYLDAKKLAVRDVLQACLAKLQSGEFSCPDQARYNITAQTPLCFGCGLRNFKSLAYQYRDNIPRDQLPAEVSARPDCHWGKNCRTQHNKPAHAARFNHVCEQTRTT